MKRQRYSTALAIKIVRRGIGGWIRPVTGGLAIGHKGKLRFAKNDVGSEFVHREELLRVLKDSRLV